MINIYIYSYLIVVLPKRVLVSETLILESINMLYSLGFHKKICRATQTGFSPCILRRTKKLERVQKSFLICENQKYQHTSIRFEECLFVWIPQRTNPVGGVLNQILESEKLEERCHRCEPPPSFQKSHLYYVLVRFANSNVIN